jgi:tetraacyldisaccharide 4'-kinase
VSGAALLRRDRRDQPWWFIVVTLPLAALMRCAVAGRGWLYDRGILSSVELPGRVISVGNLAVGGTGKTPVVMALARHLVALGHRPAILTRGYGSTLRAGDSMALSAGEVVVAPHAASSIPDEARLQSVTLPGVPVVVGRDRAAAAQRFLAQIPKNQAAPTHWLLDDGFQHRRLKRHKDIVLLDADSPLANGHLLPSGALREPPAALARADLILMTRGDDVPNAWRSKLGALTKASVFPVPFRTSMPTLAVDGRTAFDAARHNPVALMAALARPERFKRDAEALGLTVAHVVWRADHARFSVEDVQAAAANVRSIVTTGKDYWRDPAVFAGLAIPVFVIALNAELPAEALKHGV